jgi:hypothetical protein
MPDKITLGLGEEKEGFVFEEIDRSGRAVLRLPDRTRTYPKYENGYGFGYPTSQDHWGMQRDRDESGRPVIRIWKQ